MEPAELMVSNRMDLDELKMKHMDPEKFIPKSMDDEKLNASCWRVSLKVNRIDLDEAKVSKREGIKWEVNRFDLDEPEVSKAKVIECQVSKGKLTDLEESKCYLFPCVPTAPWHEQLLLKQLAGEEYRPSGGEDDVDLFDVYYVTSRLREFISDDFPNENFMFESDFEVGHHVDIKSMLLPSQKDFLVRRNGGIVKTTDLMRSSKYIMVCCFLVPDIWYSIAWYASVLCSELYTKLNENFEMVIVAKMRRGWTHDKAAFDHFLSGFHPSCLAVPFDAESHRNSLFMSLAGNIMSARTLLVAPSGNVLLHSKLHEFDGLEFIPRFGEDARPFPFIGESESSSLLTADFFTTPSSLEDFLGCKTSDFVFRKIKTSRGSNDDALELREEKMVISQLKSKLVGLYLYHSGDLLAMLRKIEEACRQSDKEFEIVILCSLYAQTGSMVVR